MQDELLAILNDDQGHQLVPVHDGYRSLVNPCPTPVNKSHPIHRKVGWGCSPAVMDLGLRDHGLVISLIHELVMDHAPDQRVVIPIQLLESSNRLVRNMWALADRNSESLPELGMLPKALGKEAVC